MRERETPPPAASRENCPVLGPSCASCVWGGEAPPLATGTVRVPTTFCCSGSLSGHPRHCLGGPPGRPSPPELAHLRQDGEVLILVLLQLEGRGGMAVAQGPEGTRPSALLPNGA